MTRSQPLRKPNLVTHLPKRHWVAMRRFTTELAAPRAPLVHDHASVVLYLEGRAKFWMQGLYELGPGDLLLVPAGSPHHAVEAHGARSIGISLCPSCMPATARAHLVAIFDGVRRGACATRHFSPAGRTRLERNFLQLERELTRADGGHELAIDAHVSLLTVLLLRASEGAPATSQAGWSPVVAQALEHVHRHATEGISLRDVAAHVSRSPAHVASLVKEATGETVVGWITRARMSQSRQLLTHTDEPTERVAERCGFSSPSHFYRAFKRAHGMTPGEWRRAPRS